MAGCVFQGIAGQVNGYSNSALVAEATMERHHHHSFALPCLKKRTQRSPRRVSSGTFFSQRTLESDEPQIAQLDSFCGGTQEIRG